MNSPAFLLALAPAATAVAGKTLSVAKSTGESFASMMGNVFDASTGPVPSGVEAKPTLAETLQSLAKELRSWLSEKGVGENYAIDFHLAADGQSEFSVSGDSANEVKQLLATDSRWLDKLGQLALTMQAKSAQLSRDFTSSSVSIEIDPRRANAF